MKELIERNNSGDDFNFSANISTTGPETEPCGTPQVL